MSGHSVVKGLSLETSVSGVGKRVGIVRTAWNVSIIDALVTASTDELLRLGVERSDITIIQVPGSFELPFGARCLIDSGKIDAVICIGCLIKGETMHFEYISDAVSQAIMKLNLADTRVPVMFGVLTCLTEDQALARAGLKPGSHNHGIDWAQGALQMADLASKYKS